MSYLRLLAILLLVNINVQAQVKPRICPDDRTGWATYMVVEHCPCTDPQTKKQCVDKKGNPKWGDEIIMFGYSCEWVRGLPNCNPPATHTPRPETKLPRATFGGTFLWHGETYWRWMVGDRVVYVGTPTWWPAESK